MIVCNEIDDGLWQCGVEWLPHTLPEVDVIVHAVPLPPSLWQLQQHPLASLTPKIFVPFADSLEPMNEVTWDVLRSVLYSISDRRVMTVCSQGKNRSGLMSALVLMARGYGVDDAILRVQKRGSDPGSVKALSNATFIRMLKDME